MADLGSSLPPDVVKRLRAIRERMIRDVAGAVADLEKLLRSSADGVKRDIIKALDLPPSRQGGRIRALLGRYHAADADLVAASIVSTGGIATALSGTYGEILDKHRASALGPVSGTTATASSTVYDGPGEAAKALDKRTLRAGAALPNPVTAGDKDAQANLRRFRGTGDVSARLHGQATANSRKATRVVLDGIKQTKAIATTARDMQRAIKIGARDKLPRLVSDLVKSGKRLAASGSPADRRAWNDTIRRLNNYQRTLRETGTVRTAYLELLQTVQSKGFRVSQVSNVVERWTYYKQRYRAEVWARTETATAYRNLQFQQDSKRSWITGYIWRMHRSTHNRWTRGRKVRGRSRRVGKPGKRKKFGGRHCICEVLNGQRLSIETAKEYPGGGHPHCNCTLEPITDKKRMLSAPVTADEERWLDG